MYVTIGSETYTKVSAISFFPETDVTGAVVPINEVQVDINTANSVALGNKITLYDDLDNLWCRYDVTYVNRISSDILQVRGQSILRRLERITLPGAMYNNISAASVISEVFADVGGNSVYTLDSSFQNATLNGYCPEQNARDRLQWVAFVIGAYIKTAFTDRVVLAPVDKTVTDIPIGDTYYRPDVTAKEMVTSLSVIAYAFWNGAPAHGSEAVEDGPDKYIFSRRKFTLYNPGINPAVADNPIVFDKITLINEFNAPNILSRLAEYYFGSFEIDADVINNAAYAPGDLVTVYTDQDVQHTGYIGNEDFSFGVQAKSRLHITGRLSDWASHALKTLTITNRYPGDTNLAAFDLSVERFQFPDESGVEIENMIFDQTKNGKRYIFRPVNKNTLWMLSDLFGYAVTVQYAKALAYGDGTLSIYSVSSWDGIEFIQHSQWPYKKDLIIQEDGKSYLIQNVAAIKTKPIEGQSCYWFSEDAVAALADEIVLVDDIPIIETADLAILEGDEWRTFYEVRYLETVLQGGGTVKWVIRARGDYDV